MKTLAIVGAACALCLLAMSAPAGTFYYAGANNGTWDNTTAQWSLNADRSGTLYAWNDVGNGGQDIASFNNTAVTDVKISGTVNANQVSSSINTDFRLGATGGTLNLTGSATINSIGSSNKIYVFYNTATGSLTGTAGLNTANNGWVFMYGNNSFSGSTSLLNGNVFDICTNTAWPSNLLLNPTSPGTKVRVENGVSATCAGLIGNGTLTGQGAGNDTLTMNRNDGGSSSYTGTIGQVKLNLVKQGNYTQVLAGGTAANDTRGGVVTVQGGILALAKTAGTDAIGSATVAGTSIMVSGGALRLDASSQINDTTSMTLSGGTFDLQTFSDTLASVSLQSGNITGSGSATLTTTGTYDMRSGSVSAILAGGVSLAKSTGGTVTLSGANSYSGGTTVAGGALLANNSSGSGTGTGGITVSSGATLGGTGIITPDSANSVTVDGLLAPGASIGTLTFDMGSTTGNVTLSPGGALTYELAAPGTGDLIQFLNFTTGDLVLNSNPVNVVPLAGFGVGDYTLFTFAGGGLAPTSGLTLGTGFSPYLLSTFEYGATDIVLHVLPEPASLALLALGGMVLLRRRR